MPTTTPFEGLTGEKRAVSLVTSRFKISQSAHSKQFTKFTEWLDMYKNRYTKRNYKGLAEIVVPKAFEKVERGTALVANAIKKVRVIPEEPSDEESARLNQSLLEFEERVLNIKKKIKYWIKSGRIHGTSYLKATWNVYDEEPDKPFYGLNVQVCDPSTVFVNPDAVSDERPRWVIHSVDVPLAELKNYKHFKNLKELENLATKTKTSPPFGKKTDEKTDTTTAMVNLKEYWGPFSKDDKSKEVPAKITVGQDTVLLEAIENPLAEILEDPIPFFTFFTYAVPHQWYGIGDIEAAESLFVELNDTRNQRMDTVTLNIDPAKEVVIAANIPESDLVAKKGWVIRSAIPNGIRFIPPDMQGVRAAIEEEKIIQGDIDRTLGIPSFGANTPVTGDLTSDTATGVRAIMAAQEIMMQSVIDETAMALRDFWRAVMAMNQKFIDRSFKISLLGDAGGSTQEEISPDRIKGNLDVDIEVQAVQDVFLDRQEVMQLFSVMKDIPGTKIDKLIRDLMGSFNKRNPEQYWEQPQPQPPQPNISISLRGELSEVEVDEYAKMTGIPAEATDPLFRPSLREQMRGNMPEQAEKDKADMEKMKIQADILQALTQSDAAAKRPATEAK